MQASLCLPFPPVLWNIAEINMKIITLVAGVLGLFFLTIQSQAQDSLKLLNGRILNVKIQRVTPEAIYYEHTSNNRSFEHHRELPLVFSYQKSGSEPIQVYQHNPEIGNVYTVPEMKLYMQGERDAYANYKSVPWNIASAAGGLAAGYYLNEGDLAMIAYPLVFPALSILTGTKIRLEDVSKPKLITDPSYRDGYKRVAKSKKFISNLKFSVFGFLAGFGISKIIED
jgi:hypothetical protein